MLVTTIAGCQVDDWTALKASVIIKQPPIVNPQQVTPHRDQTEKIKRMENKILGHLHFCITKTIV